MSERVKINIENYIAHVQLSRPDKMNALDMPMLEGIIEAGESLMGNKNVRAIVLSGEGKGFCAGLDLMSMAQIAAIGGTQDIETRTHEDCNLFQRVTMIWRDLDVPVIAAIHGTAFGGGFQIMLGADIRIIAPDTKLSIMEIKWGLVPDMGGTVLMKDLARGDIIRELVYTGRIFSGTEAKDYGFATQLSADPLQSAFELAKKIAAQSPHAILFAKQLLNDAGANNREDQLMAEAKAQKELIAGVNQKEAVMAGLNKTTPVFSD